MKTLSNSPLNPASKNVADLKIYGGDVFKLISKASSQSEGWMKSTKAMEITNIGCVIQVTTQQMNPSGSYSLAEALTFVPGAWISCSYDREGNPKYELCGLEKGSR